MGNRGRVRCADGSVFTWGPRTLSLDVSTLALDPPAATLHVGGTTAILTPPDGCPGQPWRVPPHVALAIVERVNGMRVAAGQPALMVPDTFRRTARRTAAVATSGLPWPVDDAWGYPGRTAGHTLYVHRVRGEAVLCVTTTAPVPRHGPLVPATATTQVDRVPRRAAVRWLLDNGHAPPAVLIRGRTHDDPRDRGAADT